MDKIPWIINNISTTESDCYYKTVSLGRIYTKFFDEYTKQRNPINNITLSVGDKLNYE